MLELQNFSLCGQLGYNETGDKHEILNDIFTIPADDRLSQHDLAVYSGDAGDHGGLGDLRHVQDQEDDQNDKRPVVVDGSESGFSLD